MSNQWLGDQSHVATEVAGKLLVSVSSTRIKAKLGETIAYDFAPEDIHIFDPDSGRALVHGLSAA
jgi:multiple sugar transport system ATP-binding protein